MPLSLPFATPAYADHVTERSIDIACPEDEVPQDGYSDVGNDDTSARPIQCITDYNVAKGTSPTTYNPGGNVLRRQMALFIYRIGLQAGVQFDTETDPGFSDDDFGQSEAGQETQDAVWGLANEGVVLGSNGRFRPNELVTRGQMAGFLVRIQETIGVEDFGDTDEDYFDDDDDNNTFEEESNRLAEEGVTIGIGGRNYGPLQAVTRRQMAFFLARKLDILVEAGFVDSAYEDDTNPSPSPTATSTTSPGPNPSPTATSSPTPDPGNGNQDFEADPSSDDPQLIDPGTDTLARITYTFSGLPETVDATFVPCFFVDQDENNNVTFHDDPFVNGRDFEDQAEAGNNATFDPDDDDDALRRQDNLGRSTTGETIILFANGEVDPTNGDYVDDVETDNGTLQLEFFSTVGDCFYPLVFDDSASDDRLVLDENDMPVSPFAIGGAGIPSRGEAPSGGSLEGEVIFVNEEEQYFVLNDPDNDGDQGQEPGTVDGNVYFYGDAGDDYTYAGNAGLIDDDNFDIPLEEFSEYLSAGDYTNQADVDSYSRTGTNEYEISSDYANTPRNAEAEVGDFDDVESDDNNNDVRVTWETPDPTEGLIIDYKVERYIFDDDNDPNTEDYTLDGVLFDSDNDPADTPPATNQDTDNDGIDDDVDNEVIDEDVPSDGTDVFVYVVTAFTGTGDPSLFSSNPSNMVTPELTEGAPRSLQANIASSDGNLNSGDVITLDFDQAMEDPDADPDTDSITLTDADGTVVRLVNGENADFQLASSDPIITNTNRITITVTGDPQVVSAGSPATASLPLEITGASGVEDADQDLNYDVANSPDTTLA